MNDPVNNDNEKSKTAFSKQIGTKAERKLDAQRQVNKTIWFGFGWFGLVGWSIAAPAALGVFVGLWLDNRYSGSYSWTLMLFIAGLGLGCWNAWRWVADEDARINKQRGKKDE